MAMHKHYSQGPDIIRVDERGEELVIEELKRAPQPSIAVEDKQDMEQAQYRFDCMAGMDHPLEIEHHHYKLVMVHCEVIDSSKDLQAAQPHNNMKFNKLEVEFIRAIQRRSDVAWAIDNSFDGLYVYRVEDPEHLSSNFKFAVYLKEEQATFWKLKYSGS